MKILCTADVHIGRRSTRLPPHIDGHAHSCGAAWARIVERAIEERVHLVAIAGDLVDQANRYFEAVGTLEAGFQRLAAAGIQTVVVAGNHDHDVLPALTAALPDGLVRMLGRGGQWERYTIETGGERLHVDGWSFAAASCLSSPLDAYRPVMDGAPVLALVHGDLEQKGSRYAPIQLADLRRHPDVLFILGHVHVPRWLDEVGGARYLNPGSPQAMDPGETGAHGVYILEVEGGRTEVRQVPISTVRYDLLELSVEGLEAPGDLEGRIVGAVRDGLRSLAEGADSLRCVRYRLRLTGRTSQRREIERRIGETIGDLELADGPIVGSIESFVSEVSTLRDLEVLVDGVGAPTILAGILRGRALDPALTSELRRLVAEVHGSRSFAEVNVPDELPELERLARSELDRSAALLLDELLAQKEVG